MTFYTMRPAMESEFLAAADLYQACWRDERKKRDPHWSSRDDVEDRLFRLQQFKEYGVHIINMNNKDVGLFVVTPKADEIFAQDLCLLPHYRSNGVCSDIITNLKEQATASNISLKLETQLDNLRAQELYTKSGFVRVCQTHKTVTMRWWPDRLRQL